MQRIPAPKAPEKVDKLLQNHNFAFLHPAWYGMEHMSVRMRHTSSHSKNRRSHHALASTTILKDGENGALRLPHRLDESTGMYKGIQIVPTKVMKKEIAREKKNAAHKREHIHAEGVKEPVHAEKHRPEEKSEKQSQGILGRMATKGGRAKSRSGFGGGA
jgi:ribosomal protein L32